MLAAVGWEPLTRNLYISEWSQGSPQAEATDRAYALGQERGRYWECGLQIRLLNDLVTQVKRNPYFYIPDVEESEDALVGLEAAIRILEDRAEEIRKRNGWE